jgi:methylmalonyl-CoA/ethylmalonyl-CoA epimerase
MLKRIDHLGVAVRSIAERAPFWGRALGLGEPHLEEVAGEKVKVAMLAVGESRVELLEPLGEDSVIARFLRERGEGIHHVCFAVADIDQDLRRLRAEGARVVGQAPRPGAGGALVAFLHPKSSGGVLIELKQDPGGAP